MNYFTEHFIEIHVDDFSDYAMFISKTDLIKKSFSLAVPMEITTFLGAAFAFIALGLVFFLYINRKWCFKPPKGSFSSCDESLLASTKTLHNFSKYTWLFIF